jgi:DNA-binding FadR family transcriptional regulator
MAGRMTTERDFSELSEFMQYLAKCDLAGDRLPSLAVLSQELKVSIATLREQLEVARALGLVEVKPKTGIRRLPYQFKPAVLKSLFYATATDSTHFFQAFSDLRNHVEAAYWEKAVSLLTADDQADLRGLIARAMEKLNGHPVQIPHGEHRELHLLIYRRLENPFVTGILESYWEAYEAVGLNMYTDLSYLQNVWEYHRRMVDAICRGDTAAGYHALLEHTDLIQQRDKVMPKPAVFRQEFE